MAYLAALASMMWQRYSYLIELREVLVQGPSYDPITRMRIATRRPATWWAWRSFASSRTRRGRWA